MCPCAPVRCVVVGGDGGWLALTTVTHNTMGHPPATSNCCVDASLHRQGGVGCNVGKKHAVCAANACIMLVHMCVAPCDSPCCPTLGQTIAPTQPPSGMHIPRTCNGRCARRMASGLAGRRRRGRRLHSTQARGRCVPSASKGLGGWVHLKYGRRPAGATGSGGGFVRKYTRVGRWRSDAA